MFDLFRSREKSVRILLGVLLGLVALSMVTYLIPGGYGDSGTGAPTVVAEVGGEPVTARMVQMQLQNALRNKSIPQGLEDYYVPQLVNQMVSERAMAYEAQRLGFQVSDAELANAIRSIVPAQYVEDKQLYQAFLQAQNTSIQEFEQNMRKQLLMLKLRNIAANGVVVSPQEVEQEYKRRNEKVKIEYATLTPAKIRAELKPTAEDLQKYFTQYSAGFKIPEKRSYDLVVIDPAKVGASIQVSDADVQKAYNQQMDQFRTPERVHVRHLLLKTTEKPKEVVDKLEAKANDLLKQAKGGADFAELAKKNSDDTGTQAKGGDLGWVVRGQTVPNFETAAFALKPGEISNVVRTEYGFHIIQSLEKEEARLRPLSEVKDQLVASSKQQLVNDKVQQLGEQVRAALVKNPAQAAQIAQQFGVTEVKADKVASGEALPEVGNSADFQSATAALNKGEVSQPIQIVGNKIVIAVLTGIDPARAAQFAEVQDKVRERYLDEKSREVMQQKAKDAVAQAKAAGGDLRKIAQSLNLEYKAIPEFSRDGAAEGIGSAGFLQEAFSQPAGSVIGPISANGQEFVVKVVEKISPDMSHLAQEREAILDGIKRKKARERDDLFEDGVLARLIKDGKVKIHEDAVKRLTQAFRG